MTWEKEWYTMKIPKITIYPATILSIFVGCNINHLDEDISEFWEGNLNIPVWNRGGNREFERSHSDATGEFFTKFFNIQNSKENRFV